MQVSRCVSVCLAGVVSAAAPSLNTDSRPATDHGRLTLFGGSENQAAERTNGGDGHEAQVKRPCGERSGAAGFLFGDARGRDTCCGRRSSAVQLELGCVNAESPPAEAFGLYFDPVGVKPSPVCLLQLLLPSPSFPMCLSLIFMSLLFFLFILISLFFSPKLLS